jgi:hypothetical protein
MRKRYIVELERTEDNRVVGVLHRHGLSEPLPFSGWIELLSLFDPPVRAESEPVLGQDPDLRRVG